MVARRQRKTDAWTPDPDPLVRRSGRCLSGRNTLAVLVLTACGGCCIAGGGTTLFPAGHRLSTAAWRLAASASRPVPVPRELEKTVLPTYIVQPGDGLLVEPTDYHSPIRIPADQPVLLDGTIDLGRYGRPVVAGRTLEEIELLVYAAVRLHERDPCEFNVRLINPASAVYYVLGDVHAPGAYPYTGRETALDAILVAGGLSDRSSRCDIVLSRPSYPDDCRTVLPICYDHIVQLGDTTTNYQLAPGDRIFVASRSCWQDLTRRLFHRDCALCDGCGAQARGNMAVVHPPPVMFVLPSPEHGGDSTLLPVPDPRRPGAVEIVPPAPADEARRAQR